MCHIRSTEPVTNTPYLAALETQASADAEALRAALLANDARVDAALRG